eukprot:8743627-Pyramimonas_sp.AAC.2
MAIGPEIQSWTSSRLQSARLSWIRFFKHGKKRNFIARIDPRHFPSEGSQGRAEEKDTGQLVRVNGRIDPYNAQIKCRPAWPSWERSSAGRSRGTQSWIYDIVDMSASMEVEEPDRVAIFAQPPRIRVDGTSIVFARVIAAGSA